MSLLRTGRVVAILRGGRAGSTLPAAHTLIDSGIRCLEITTNTPDAEGVIRELLAAYPGGQIELGMGTVRRAAQVAAAAEAGATFCVSPNLDLEVGAGCAQAGLDWYPGCLTPTEIETAHRAGASAVKVFPASALGGPSYVRAVRAPLDDIDLIPTGGVGVEHVAAYLDAGAVAVGMSGPLIGDALDGGDLTELARRASRVVDTITEWEASR